MTKVSVTKSKTQNKVIKNHSIKNRFIVFSFLILCLTLLNGLTSPQILNAAVTNHQSLYGNESAKGNKAVNSAPQKYLQVADNGFFTPFANTFSNKKRIRKYKAKKAKLVKPDYNLGAKLSNKGYIKTYNGKPGNLDPGANYYRARKYNGYDDGYYGRPVSGKKYRTMCVRLKDGFYWPINFAQKKNRFKRDRIKCQKSCSSEVRLYFYPTKGGDIVDMRDIKGRRYASLKTAYLYRTKYVKGADCKPKPWSKEAKATHAKYAVKDGEKKRRMHVALTKRAERIRVAALKRTARRGARLRKRHIIKKRGRKRSRRHSKLKHRVRKNKHARKKKAKYRKKLKVAKRPKKVKYKKYSLIKY